MTIGNHCSSCEEDLSKYGDIAFCPKCGNETESMGYQSCPSCEADLSEFDDLAYCPKCGIDLDSNSTGDIRGQQQESINTPSNSEGSQQNDTDADEDKSFRERVEEIRERRAKEGNRSSSGRSDDSTNEHDRGTLVFPQSEHFLQKLEARARDGQASLVETAYALTGQDYTSPTNLIPLDDDKHYLISTERMTSYNVNEMAREVASSYPGTNSPKSIAKFHTHPGGLPTPSPADQSNAYQTYQAFASAFGTSDFEFFHGIHGLIEHGRSVAPELQQQPKVMGNQIIWDDPKFTHHIAVFGPRFQQQKPIRIDE